ncbi:MAG: glycerate kinase [Kiritimatiellae bacterium]|nr:glycerate kinase [Kiritimatiellia bacterium]
MKVAIAIDSFKGSLGSIEAGNAVAEGIKRVVPEAECAVRALADGGEGTVEALATGLGGELRRVPVTGPAGKTVVATYGIAGSTAIMEMAQAAGITLVSGEEKNPLKTTTFGVGEMIKDAIAHGCRRFVIGIGGSATNDAGAGMLQALGFGLSDSKGDSVGYGGGSLADIAKIDRRKILPELGECEFRVACDVTNPLCGEKGASAVYGPQKGATPEMVAELDSALAHFATVAGGDAQFPGSGAAGGLGFAFREFLGAELKSGVEIVLEEIRFGEVLSDADLVITGEGRLDSQTIMGKAPIGVARMAKKYGKKVLAFSGCATRDAGVVNDYGIDAFFPILREVVPLETALEKSYAAENLAATTEQVLRCFLLGAH